MKRPTCPKCGRRMILGSKAASGKQRWLCRDGGLDRTYCYSTTQPGAAPRTQAGRREAVKVQHPRRTAGVTRLLITAAQNATPAHKGFMRACETFCNKHSADLMVIPLRYKNPTSRWSASQANEEVWAPEFTPYLCNTRRRLNRNLVVMGDVKTQPTAMNPLTGYEALTHGESGVLGHTKLAFRTVPTPQSKYPKVLTTTGAATLPNYTDSKAGKLGEFHRTLGACLVELQGGKFHLRQINADKTDGSFIDLDTLYSAEGAREAPPALALIMGDTHVDFIDPAVVRGTFGERGILDTLRPKHLVWHDLLDGYATNPHHNGNPFNAIAKLRADRSDARAEVFRAIEFVRAHTPKGVTSVVVPSNHDDFLTRWIISQDWRNAPGNAEFYLETALAMVRGTRMDASGTRHPSPLPYWGRKMNCERIRFLDRDESFVLAGIELGMHGDKGPNGARGSVKNLRRIGVRSVIGHSHSPAIDEGCYQTGTSTRLRLEYNIGPSGWLNTHCVVYANGKRSLINLIDGEWRL